MFSHFHKENLQFNNEKAEINTDLFGLYVKGTNRCKRPLLTKSSIKGLISESIATTELKFKFLNNTSNLIELEFIFAVDPLICIEELSAQYKDFKIKGYIDEK